MSCYHSFFHMKSSSLKSFANLRIGITLKAHQAVAANGIPVVQMRDLVGTSVRTGTLAKLDIALPRRTTFLQYGDIIFRSRGVTTTAAAVPRNMGKAVLASPLFLIRIKDHAPLLPGYLCWYINQPSAQRFLTRRAEGSSLKMISMKHLRELEIPTPSMHAQKTIVRIDALLRKEAELLEDLKRKRSQYMETALRHTASKHETGGAK